MVWCACGSRLLFGWHVHAGLGGLELKILRMCEFSSLVLDNRPESFIAVALGGSCIPHRAHHGCCCCACLEFSPEELATVACQGIAFLAAPMEVCFLPITHV